MYILFFSYEPTDFCCIIVWSCVTSVKQLKYFWLHFNFYYLYYGNKRCKSKRLTKRTKIWEIDCRVSVKNAKSKRQKRTHFREGLRYASLCIYNYYSFLLKDKVYTDGREIVVYEYIVVYKYFLYDSQIRAVIPEKRLKFSGVEKAGEEEPSTDTEGVFTIIQRPFTHLCGGEALITFEEEKGTYKQFTNTVVTKQLTTKIALPVKL